jgi:hypothetical protein
VGSLGLVMRRVVVQPACDTWATRVAAFSVALVLTPIMHLMVTRAEKHVTGLGGRALSPFARM